MPEWIWCDERMPDKDAIVIGYDTFYGRIGEAQTSSWAGRLVFMDSDDCNIVCWQPLPQPPTREQVEAHSGA